MGIVMDTREEFRASTQSRLAPSRLPIPMFRLPIRPILRTFLPPDGRHTIFMEKTCRRLLLIYLRLVMTLHDKAASGRSECQLVIGCRTARPPNVPSVFYSISAVRNAS